MIKINDTVLVIRNARDKIQTAQYVLEQAANTYTIKRYTGQFGGKITEQPEIIIEKGKAKRSALQQAELEYNALIKKSCDKGYKKLVDLTKISFLSITSEELDKLVPRLKTDQNGNTKPQLAKSSNDCTINVWDKEMWCSRKIDGVRCLMTWNEETEEIDAISRGGGDYNIATTHLRNNKTLIKLLSENLGLILDGELYYHGWSLQKISGTCRLKTWEEKCNTIEYWIYDIADDTKEFDKRYEYILDLKDVFEDETQIKILDHYLLTGWTNVKKYHDKFVSEGFEGLVARKPNKKYAPGKRNSDWIKLKDYKDSEFEIIGVSKGLRPEDMCFVCITNDGKEFKAKPIGDRDLKYEYLENQEYYIGRKATVKYFNMSEDGIPTQPVLKSIREDGE